MPNASPIHVARFFLDRVDPAQVLSELHLHHWVYWAHGWMMAVRSQPLVSQTATAEIGGPVYPAIRTHVRDLNLSSSTAPWNTPDLWPQGAVPLTDDEVQVCDMVWSKYHGYTRLELIGLQTGPHTPWSAAFFERGRGTQIFNTDTRAYCLALAREGRKARALVD